MNTSTITHVGGTHTLQLTLLKNSICNNNYLKINNCDNHVLIAKD